MFPRVVRPQTGHDLSRCSFHGAGAKTAWCRNPSGSDITRNIELPAIMLLYNVHHLLNIPRRDIIHSPTLVDPIEPAVIVVAPERRISPTTVYSVGAGMPI